MGGDAGGWGRLPQRGGFNPRPRMGGDSETLQSALDLLKFQSTPPHGGRPNGDAFIAKLNGFNPRPRMGGDASLPHLPQAL